jgi:hypothetical protein
VRLQACLRPLVNVPVFLLTKAARIVVSDVVWKDVRLRRKRVQLNNLQGRQRSLILLYYFRLSMGLEEQSGCDR